MNENIYQELDLAMIANEERQIEILTTGAKIAFVAGTIGAINSLGKNGIIADEIIEIGAPHTFPVSKTVMPELIERVIDPAEKYAKKYQAELIQGGRYINKPILGDRNAVTGVRQYLGYNREWTPWFSEANTIQRQKMIGVVQAGEKIGLWPAMTQEPELGGTGYPEGSLADILHNEIGIDNITGNYKSRASTIARTETQNIRHIAAVERYKAAGIGGVTWICAGGPCQEICSQFCGQTYKIEDLPFGGEKAHPNCRCDLKPVVGLF